MPYVLSKVRRMTDLLCYLLGIEAIQAAQAADLSQNRPSGQGTAFAYRQLRERIPMLTGDDRDLGADIQQACQLVKDRCLLPKEE